MAKKPPAVKRAAPETLPESSGNPQGETQSAADRIAEYIGRSLAELGNRKDALAQQLVEVERQLGEVKARIGSQIGSAMPAVGGRARKKAAPKKSRAKAQGSAVPPHVKRAAGRAPSNADKPVSRDARALRDSAQRKRWSRHPQTSKG
jgi:hypothetical protein